MLVCFRITQTIHEKSLRQAKNLTEEKEENHFPWSEGSHTDLEKVSLEFVKTVCKVCKLPDLREVKSMVDGFKVTWEQVTALSNYVVEKCTHRLSTDNSRFQNKNATLHYLQEIFA
jgi:hypothetical protein